MSRTSTTVPGLAGAGLTPLEAITTATKNAAALMNATDWGTLEPGKLANLVIVKGQPDQQIHDTHHVEMVMKEGTVLNRERLRFDAARDPVIPFGRAAEMLPDFGHLHRSVLRPLSNEA